VQLTFPKAAWRGGDGCGCVRWLRLQQEGAQFKPVLFWLRSLVGKLLLDYFSQFGDCQLAVVQAIVHSEVAFYREGASLSQGW